MPEPPPEKISANPPKNTNPLKCPIGHFCKKSKHSENL